MKRIALAVLLALFLAAGYALWTRVLFPTSGSLRYRLVVEVEDNGRTVAGSSVVEVSLHRNVIGTPYAMGLRGEAVTVDLGIKGLLFAVMRCENASHGCWEMFPERVLAARRDIEDRRRGDRLTLFRAVSRLPDGTSAAIPWQRIVQTGPRPWDVERYPFGPMLVRLRDINDPTSVEKIDPENLAKSLGHGVRLKAITIVKTSEPVSEQIEGKMPAYGNNPQWRAWFMALPYGHPLKFGPDVFLQGFR